MPRSWIENRFSRFVLGFRGGLLSGAELTVEAVGNRKIGQSQPWTESSGIAGAAGGWSAGRSELDAALAQR
jgi:hypothetical protein